MNPKKVEETPVVEEPVKEVAEEPVKEEKTEETPVEEEKTEDKFDRKKKKGGETAEVDKAELLERPENAVSVTEYMEQLKIKNQGLVNKPVKKMEVVQADLQAMSKGETSTKVNKKEMKPKKEKKNNHQDINVDFKTEDAQGDRYERQERNYGKKKNNQSSKFQFSNDDFPEL